MLIGGILISLAFARSRICRNYGGDTKMEVFHSLPRATCPGVI
jgi:hypothetical protein